MDIRTGNHLNQRDTAAVKVDNGAFALIVQQLAGILLEMNALKTHALGLSIHLKIDIAVLTDRHIKLRNLICLRQIWIEIILSVGFAELIDVAMRSNTHLRGIMYDLFVQNGQCTRLTGADRADMCIDLCAEGCAAAAEYF